MNQLFLVLMIASGLGSASYAQTQVDPNTQAPVAQATPVQAPAPQPEPQPAPQSQQCVNRDDGSSLCVNDRVLDYRNETGTLTVIYSNFTGAVKYDSGDVNTIDLQYVSREVNCIYGFCSGDVVSDSDDIQGTINEVFENGVAEVVYEDGETWYLEVNELTAVAGETAPVDHDWPAPRVYPDVYVYHCVFPEPVYVYPWPLYYPYGFPVLYGRVVIHGIFPPPPRYFGYHPYGPYPYHPVGSWGVHVGGQRGYYNGHPGYGFPGGHGPRPGPVGPRPGNGGFPGGNHGPRPGNGGFPGNNGPRPGPVGPRPGPIGGGGHPGGGFPGPRPGPVGGGGHPGNGGGGFPAPRPPSGGGFPGGGHPGGGGGFPGGGHPGGGGGGGHPGGGGGPRPHP